MTDLYLLEPVDVDPWFPYGDSRPICELRAGAWLIRERWEAIVDSRTRGVFAPEHLNLFAEDSTPPVLRQEAVAAPALVGRSDFAPSGAAPDFPAGSARLVNDGDTVGWWVADGQWDRSTTDWPELEIEGVSLRGSYDIVTALEHLLAADVIDFVHERGDSLPDGSIIIGEPANIVSMGAVIEPGVTFDSRNGVIVIEQHAYVKAGTRLEGPLYIGPGTEVLGGEIRNSSFGPRCHVRGEISSSVFLGYANKGHEGFIGHSVVGRWVNLGAGTTTSNLKNTYGEVKQDVPGRPVETGRQFLGTIFGDHAKTAIGTLMPTGALVGAGANVLSEGTAPKYVRPFAWSGSELMNLEGFLRTAERVMPRRNVTFTPQVRDFLTDIYHRATDA